MAEENDNLAQNVPDMDDNFEDMNPDNSADSTEAAVDALLGEKIRGEPLPLLDIENDEVAQDIDAAFDPRLAEMVTPAGSRDLEAVYNVPVRVKAVLGVSKIKVSDLLRMRRGTVIDLDRKVGEAIDIYVNERLVARGEVVVVDNHLGITMTEIIKSDQF